MNRRRDRNGGFALLLVLVWVGVAVVLGLSYLSSAAVKAGSSDNLLQSVRARYLAESAMQHAMYVFKTDRDLIDGSSEGSPLGPYYVDESDDSYVLYAVQDPDIEDRYIVTTRGRVGGITQSVSAVVYCSSAEITIKHGIVVDHKECSFPSTLTVNGDVHVNDDVNNSAFINGDVSSSGAVSDPLGRITGTITEDAPREDCLKIKVNDYKHEYYVDGVEYESVEIKKAEILAADDPLADGGAITATNIGGIVILQPKEQDKLTLTDGLNFLGTLVVKGDLVLDGNNVTLTPVEGFPALVVSGQVYITGNTDITINGLVSFKKEILPIGDTSGAKTEISGALICEKDGYSLDLGGQHTLNYIPERCRIHDVNNEAGDATVELLTWID